MIMTSDSDGEGAKEEDTQKPDGFHPFFRSPNYDVPGPESRISSSQALLLFDNYLDTLYVAYNVNTKVRHLTYWCNLNVTILGPLIYSKYVFSRLQQAPVVI